ncbi:hypothetical protein P8610_09425 [Fictibacillus sp. UD]
MQGARLSARTSGQVRPRQRNTLGRLTARPAESEAPGAEINRPRKLTCRLKLQRLEALYLP